MNAPTNEVKPSRLGAAQLRLLERLSNACSVSGDESEVRKIVLEQVRLILASRKGEVKVDALGNVLVHQPGEGSGPRQRVMLAAHMDEVGFMIMQEEDKGIFRFEIVGGIDARQLAGKPVWVGHTHVPGVIGARPIHLTQPEERRHTISADTLRIDVGPESRGIQIGDRATFATTFSRLGSSLFGKALDNRLGVSVLLELVRNAPASVDLLAAFTVQEEIGSGGARVAAYAFHPDLAIALDSTPANDLPAWSRDGLQLEENTLYNTRLDGGPALYIADRGTLSDPRLVRFFAEIGDRYHIPYQFRQPGGGGTDAHAIHLQNEGIPSISISVPSRYQHTAASIGRVADWQNSYTLIHTALSHLTMDVMAGDR